MKKMISFIRSYFGHMGAYFMLTMLVFGFVSVAMESPTVNLVLIWSALLFGALTALCDLVYLASFLRSYLAKTAIHGILTVISFAIDFIAASGVIERGKTAVYGVLFFSVFYLILATVRCVYHYATAKKDNAKKAYQSLYTPQNID